MLAGDRDLVVQALMINIDNRDKDIRCNAICLAFVRTPHGLREIDEFKKLGIASGESATPICS